MNPTLIDELGWAMGQVYGSVQDRILVNLAKYFPYLKPGQKVPGSFEYQARMLAKIGQVNRETEKIIIQSLGGEDEALQLAGELAGIKDPKIISSKSDNLRDFIFSFGSSVESATLAKQLESLATPSVSYLWMN